MAIRPTTGIGYFRYSRGAMLYRMPGAESATSVLIRALVVGGGGPGGAGAASANNGGGGSGGEFKEEPAFTLPIQEHIITVGVGGTSTVGTDTDGSASSIGRLISSQGGGHGGGRSPLSGASSGAYGGGGGPIGNQPGATGAIAYRGGNGVTGYPFQGGGGGGAGGPGHDGNEAAPLTGDGGIGRSSDISGILKYYSGGGGGGADPTAGDGGLGGGGAGGSGLNLTPGIAGTANTGGGGGGGSSQGTIVGGAGGSGIVIIRYAGSPKFSGGTVTTVNGDTVHTFTSSGRLTPL